MTNPNNVSQNTPPPNPTNQNIVSEPQVSNIHQVSNIPQVNNSSILDKITIDKSTMIIIFVIILLLIFLGVMYYYFSKKKENKEQSSTPPENTNPGGIETVPQSEQESSDSPRPSIEPFINYLEGDFEPCRPDMYTNDINKLLPGLLV